MLSKRVNEEFVISNMKCLEEKFNKNLEKLIHEKENNKAMAELKLLN